MHLLQESSTKKNFVKCLAKVNKHSTYSFSFITLLNFLKEYEVTWHILLTFLSAHKLPPQISSIMISLVILARIIGDHVKLAR